MNQKIPDADCKIVEEFVRAYDTAFRTRDGGAYVRCLRQDFQTKGNPMALGDFPPETVERLLKTRPSRWGYITNGTRHNFIEGHGAATKRISFFSSQFVQGWRVPEWRRPCRDLCPTRWEEACVTHGAVHRTVPGLAILLL